MDTPTPSLDATEKVGAEGATAPRITLDYMKSQVAYCFYRTADAAFDANGLQVLDHMTLCCLVLRSGFIVIGKSTPMSADNFDAEKGRIFAYEDAVRGLWPLFAFHNLQAQADAR